MWTPRVATGGGPGEDTKKTCKYDSRASNGDKKGTACANAAIPVRGQVRRGAASGAASTAGTADDESARPVTRKRGRGDTTDRSDDSDDSDDDERRRREAV